MKIKSKSNFLLVSIASIIVVIVYSFWGYNYINKASGFLAGLSEAFNFFIASLVFGIVISVIFVAFNAISIGKKRYVVVLYLLVIISMFLFEYISFQVIDKVPIIAKTVSLNSDERQVTWNLFLKNGMPKEDELVLGLINARYNPLSFSLEKIEVDSNRTFNEEVELYHIEDTFVVVNSESNKVLKVIHLEEVIGNILESINKKDSIGLERVGFYENNITLVYAEDYSEKERVATYREPISGVGLNEVPCNVGINGICFGKNFEIDLSKTYDIVFTEDMNGYYYRHRLLLEKVGVIDEYEDGTVIKGVELNNAFKVYDDIIKEVVYNNEYDIERDNQYTYQRFEVVIDGGVIYCFDNDNNLITDWMNMESFINQVIINNQKSPLHKEKPIPKHMQMDNQDEVYGYFYFGQDENPNHKNADMIYWLLPNDEGKMLLVTWDNQKKAWLYTAE